MAALDRTAHAVRTAIDQLPLVFDVDSRPVTVRWNERLIVVLARRTPHLDRPLITDLVSLALYSGTGPNPTWRRPVVVDAIVEIGRNPTAALARAMRRDNYATRRAVLVPASAMTFRRAAADHARAGARLWGIWLLTHGLRGIRIDVPGAPGSSNAPLDLGQRLLDELVAAQLPAQEGG